MRTILNDCELEEFLSNKWSNLRVEFPNTPRLKVYYSEPDDVTGDGTWVWSDKYYHLLTINGDDETEWTTLELDDLAWRLYCGPLYALANTMDGDVNHNLIELASILGPECRRYAEEDTGS